MKNIVKLLLLGTLLSGVAQASSAPLQCGKDTDCKVDRICESGQCVNPPNTVLNALTNTPAAPTIAYEPIMVSDNEAGPFSIEYMDMGTALQYLSRAGVVNLLESVVEDPEATGYVDIVEAYAFGPNRYVIIISTGERGNSCPASTYAISYDTTGEYVVGSIPIDGCSEAVQAFAEGNKLSIKKEGETTVIYNAEIK